MPLLQHPDTGQQVHASKSTAARLIEEDGWAKLPETQYADASGETPAPAEPVKENDPPKQDPPGTPSTPAAIPAPKKPLGEMLLRELVAYAETIGMDTTDLKKAGMSKAKATEAINAHVAAASK